MRYFLRLANESVFEEVDEYTFKNAKFALTDDETASRYTEDFVKEHEGVIDISLFTASLLDISILYRLFTPPGTPEKVPNGLVRSPKTIKFRKRNIIKMREMNTGGTWTKDAA